MRTDTLQIHASVAVADCTVTSRTRTDGAQVTLTGTSGQELTLDFTLSAFHTFATAIHKTDHALKAAATPAIGE